MISLPRALMLRSPVVRTFLMQAAPTTLLVSLVAFGIARLIRPVFGPHPPVYAEFEFGTHIAVVDATLQSWQVTHGLPISTMAIRDGVDYPYILFGNTAFYLISAGVAAVLDVPAYLGAGITLSIAFGMAAVGMFIIATSAGVNRYLAAALGFLYAAGPYLCVNIFVRNAFPEYFTWLLVPSLFLAVRWSLDSDRPPWTLAIGALALAAPFYLHKLLAPHIALTLMVLGLNVAPWRWRTVIRAGFVGASALLLSVPGWLPPYRGLSADLVRAYGGDAVPTIYHMTWWNLFSPWAADTLPTGPLYDFYGGRFALQLGIVPIVGGTLAIGLLLTAPRIAWKRRMILPIGIFAVMVTLVSGWLGLWQILPAPLRYIQFAYRLIGLAHFVGFILLFIALGSTGTRIQRAPEQLQRVAAEWLVIIAVLCAQTYWHNPPLSTNVSADIRGPTLGPVDRCSLCPSPPDTTAAPRVLPIERVVNRGPGSHWIDARELDAGEYLLPILSYSFARVYDASGAVVPTHSFDRQAVLVHDGFSSEYRAIYDFTPEVTAMVAGIVVVLIGTYAVWIIGRKRLYQSRVTGDWCIKHVHGLMMFRAATLPLVISQAILTRTLHVQTAAGEIPPDDRLLELQLKALLDESSDTQTPA